MAQTERTIRRAGTLSFLIFLAVSALGWWLLPALVSFPESLIDRIAFALQVSTVPLFCVLVGVGMVSTGRRFSPDDISGSAFGPPSDSLAIKVAFLQNTLEQAVLAVGFYLAFVTVADGPWLSVLLVSAALFVIGRVLFYRGYSKGVEGRAFGMTLTMTPAIVGYPVVFVLIFLRLLG